MLGHHHVVVGWAGVISIEALATAAGHPLSDFTGINIAGVPVPEMPFLLAAAAFGSLLPDIDHPKAALANYRIAGIPFFKAASYATSVFVRHRGPTHSLLAWIVLSVLAASIGLRVGLLYFSLAASLGYLLHLVGDSLTRSGVPWLWPVSGEPMGLPMDRHRRFQTGSLMEYLIVALVIGCTTLIVLRVGFPVV